MTTPLLYTPSRFAYHRRQSRAVRVGSVQVGGLVDGRPAPLVVQTMCTTKTTDVAATVSQSIRCIEAGSQIVRITAPGVKDAQALKDIRAQLSAAGFPEVPLCADIHFMPAAAMEAVEHVEKVRVNPGNFADKKAFKVIEYTDQQYREEVERVAERFLPLVRRAKVLGRSLRIGTNHGSLSDRIMNRFGDTPRGMVESAMEFVRIAESEGFHELIISMKSSNPKVMVQAYRLLVAELDRHGQPYPLHLGVTEAGDGEDGRVKSAAGIGALLEDGLGDTIRVSLTEPPECEIPVAQALAKRYAAWCGQRDQPIAADMPRESVDPYQYRRQASEITRIGADIPVGGTLIPRVLAPINAQGPRDREPAADALVADAIAWPLMSPTTPGRLAGSAGAAPGSAGVPPAPGTAGVSPARVPTNLPLLVHQAGTPLPQLTPGSLLLLNLPIESPAAALRDTIRALPAGHVIGLAACAPLGETRAYRLLAATIDEEFRAAESRTAGSGTRHAIAIALPFQRDDLAIAAIAGGLLIDGIGDALYLPGASDPRRLAFTLLQAVKARVTRADYVSCPSCGRTQFDLMEVTGHIREATNHLDGVTIAIMGCIVNGPGEMADADFGYVGAAPGKIDLYRRKEKVRSSIPQVQARDELIALIKEHGLWRDVPA